MKHIVLFVVLCITVFSIVPSNNTSLEQKLYETQVTLETRLAHLQSEIARLKLEKCTKKDIDIVVTKKLETSEYVRSSDFLQASQALENSLLLFTSRIDELSSRLQNLECRFMDMQKESQSKIQLAHQVAGLHFTIQKLENRITQLECQEALVKLDKDIQQSFPGSPQEKEFFGSPPKLGLETAPQTPVVGHLDPALITKNMNFPKNETLSPLDSEDND